MNKQFILSSLIAGLLFSSSSISFAQKKPKATRLETTTSTETLYYGDCSPIDEIAVITLSKNGELMLGSSKIEKANLMKEVRSRICGKLPPDQIIHVKADAETAFSQIIEILKSGREIKVDDFGLKIFDTKDSDIVSTANMVKVPEQEENTDQKIKAHPLALFVSIGEDGNMQLNSKPETLDSLIKRLKQIFLTRKQKKIYMSGSREVEKTVFISANAKAKFSDVIKTIETAKNAGSFPIGLDIDNNYEKIIFGN